MNQFQFGFCGNVKDLLLTMLSPMTLKQAIAQTMRCDNRPFECWQEKHWEPSPTWRQFTPPMLQPKHMVPTPKDNPMQIDKSRFKPFTKHEKQCWFVNNFYLYCGEPSHIASVYPNKRVQHVARTTISTITHGQKRRETRTSTLCKDRETGLQCIMRSKQPYVVLRTNTFFLLPIMIKGDKSTTMQTQALLDSWAYACFIDKELVRQHNLELVEKVTPVAVEVIDGWNLSSRPIMHETKALIVTIGSHNSKVVFNVISSPTNPIIIGLSWLILHNLWMVGKRKVFILNTKTINMFLKRKM